LACGVPIDNQWMSECESTVSAGNFVGVTNGRGNGDMMTSGPRMHRTTRLGSDRRLRKGGRHYGKKGKIN